MTPENEFEMLNTKEYYPTVKIPQPIIMVKELSAFEQCVYGALFSHAGKNNRCFPKQTTLAKELDVSVRAIEDSISKLKKLNLIASVKPGHPLSLSPHGCTYLLLNSTCFKEHPKKNKDVTVGPTQATDRVERNVTSSESLDKIHEKEGLTYTEPKKDLETIVSSKEETLSADRASQTPIVSRKLNRGSNVSFVEESIPNLPTQETTKDSPIKDYKPVRRLVRGNDTNPPTENKLSTVEKLLQMQDASYQVPPTPIVPKLPPIVVEILSYWNKHSGATVHKLPNPGEMPTNTVKKSCKLIKNLLKGLAFSGHETIKFTEIVTQPDIEDAIDLFHEVVTNPDILPSNKEMMRRFTFPRFIYDPISGISNFLKCFNKEVMNINNICKDPIQKEVYEALKTSYDKFFSREREFTISEMRKISIGANLLIDKMDEFAKTRTIHNIDLHRSIDDDDLWADWVMESLIDNFGKNISVGNIASRYTYDVCLIRYLEKKGRLDTEEKKERFNSYYDEEQEVGSFFPPEYANRTIQMEEY